MEAKQAHLDALEQRERAMPLGRILELLETLEAREKVISVLSERIKELEYSSGKTRVRDLWLRGII